MPPRRAGPGLRRHPLFGERRPQRRHLGARRVGAGERCPTREPHVTRAGEGGQGAPSLPAAARRAWSHRVEHVAPTTHSLPVRPARSLPITPRPPRRPGPRPPRPARLAPPRPPAAHSLGCAAEAPGAHTAGLRAEPEPEPAPRPRARPHRGRSTRSPAHFGELVPRGSPAERTARRFRDRRQERTVAPARRAMERIPSAQPPPSCLPKAPGLAPGDLPGMDFAQMFQVYKSRRGIKRSEDSKETYKLPHRLIEKKRRDRINECIAQLKDLLPEHLKLTTLGHLEKAVVLELTLKHVRALTSLIDQQQQKILALQSGLQAGELSGRGAEAGQELFCSGFQTCAREVLQYLGRHEHARDLKATQLVAHLHRVATELLQAGAPRRAADPAAAAAVPTAADLEEKAAAAAARASEGAGRNCVPVIQRTFAPSGGEQSGSDTDTDSGYGGESEKGDARGERPYLKSDRGRGGLAASAAAVGARVGAGAVKQEPEEPPAKKGRLQLSDDDDDEGRFPRGGGGDLLGPPFLGGPHPHPPPLCLPFYLIPPSATAYLPMLEKCWYPASLPLLCPGLGGASSFVSPDKLGGPLLLPQRLPSPLPPHPALDSSALLQALKHIPPLHLETKD